MSYYHLDIMSSISIKNLTQINNETLWLNFENLDDQVKIKRLIKISKLHNRKI